MALGLIWCGKQKEFVKTVVILFLFFATGHVFHLSLLVDLRTAQMERHVSLMVLPTASRNKTRTSSNDSTNTSNNNNNNNNNSGVQLSTQETKLTDDKKKSPGRIPHRLVFTHKANILQEKNPPHIYDNIMNTIQMYQQAWNEPNASIWFLSNDDCQRALAEAEPALVPHFLREQSGAFKGDICRVAALYLKGGYYFDADMKAIRALGIESDVGFASVLLPEGQGFFQSFLASEPRSLILKEALHIMLDYYEGQLQLRTDIRNTSIPVSELIDIYEKKMKSKDQERMRLSKVYDSLAHQDNETDTRQLLLQIVEKAHNRQTIVRDLMGPGTLKRAYDNIVNNDSQNVSLGQTLLLQESNLESSTGLYPDLERQGGMGCCCQFIVHDWKRPYFWSRMVGASRRCAVKKGNEVTQNVEVRLKKVVAHNKDA